MKINFEAVRRTLYAALAVMLLVVGLSVGWYPGKASATLLASRSIKLSDSGASGTSITTGVGSGTAVSYAYSFTTANAAQSLIVDFCGNSPIIADSCTAPTGFDASAAALTAGSGMAGWTLTATTSQLKLTGSSVSAGSQSFTITGVTNPSGVGTFYARVYTFANATFGTYASATNPGNYVDYGGVALSTANVVSVTARVQETLTFCVSGQIPGPNCGTTGQAVTSPAIILGHGVNNILDSSQVDTNNVYTQTSSNASSGVIIRMRSGAASGGLNNGTDFIPAVNSGANTPAAIGAGVAAFGLFVASGSGGTGTITADANYNDGTATDYGMDTTTVNNNVLSTYGDTIAASSAPINNVSNTLTFAAQASNTTPAGVYTANIALIATGTF